MRNPVLIAVLILGFSGNSIGGTYGRPGLSFKAGFCYDFLSQDFFLDSLARAGADSLEITTSLKTIYLDDFKSRMALRYNPFEDNRVELEGVYEQTSEEHRLRGYCNFRPVFGPFRLDWSSDFDWRDGSVSPAAGDLGYLSGSSRFKMSMPVSSSVSLWGRSRAEIVRFDSAAWGTFDHQRLGGELGVSHSFSGFSSVSASGFISKRFVPDSPGQEYRSFGFDGTLLKLYEGGEFDVLTHWESRDYAKADNLDDYWRADLDFRHRHSFGYRYFIREEGEAEIIKFDSTDYLTNSYSRFELAVMGGLMGAGGSVAGGPRLEILRADQVDPQTIGEDYVEYGIKGQFDLICLGWPFVSLESVTGRRNLKDNSSADDLHSDFAVERLSVLIDWLPAGRLNLNLLFSADWEWHDNPDENCRLILFTSGLTYSF